MAEFVPPIAVGTVLEDRVIADASTFENFAVHYTKIMHDNKKHKMIKKRSKRIAVRRSERIKAKTEREMEKVCNKKIKRSLSTTIDSASEALVPVMRFCDLKRKRKAEFRRKIVLPEDHCNDVTIYISDDEDLKPMDVAPEEIVCEPAGIQYTTADNNNNDNFDNVLPRIEVQTDGSSTEEDDHEDVYIETIEYCCPSNPRRAEGMHYYEPTSSYARTFHEAYSYSTNQMFQQHVTPSPSPIIHSPSTPTGGLPYHYQQMPMTGVAPHVRNSGLYSSNQSFQQRMTPTYIHPPSTPEHASQYTPSVSEQLPNTSGASHPCLLQVNQLTAVVHNNPHNSYFNPGLDLFLEQMELLLRVPEEVGPRTPPLNM